MAIERALPLSTILSAPIIGLPSEALILYPNNSGSKLFDILSICTLLAILSLSLGCNSWG